MSGGQSRSVLIVEDEAIIAMALEDALAEAGMSSRYVSTFAGAMALIQQGDYRGTIVDVGLPDGRGDELADAMRAVWPRLPIVLCTGYSLGDVRCNAFAQGGVVVIGKPFHAAQIVTAFCSAEAGALDMSATPDCALSHVG